MRFKRFRLQPRPLIVLTLAFIAASVWSAVVSRTVSLAQSVTADNEVAPLMTSNRTALKVCVDSKVLGISNEELKASIEASLLNMTLHEDYEPSGLPTVPTQVDIGCPGPARAMSSGFDWMFGSLPSDTVAVSEPSQYRVFVFVVPDQYLAAPNGSRFWRAPQEIFCRGGGFCGEVTTALYLSAGDMSDILRISKLLTNAVGFDVPELYPDRPDPNGQ